MARIKPKTEEELEHQIYWRIEKIYGELIVAWQYAVEKIKKSQNRQKENYEKRNQIETYEISDQKILGLLKNQIKKANLPGTCIISQNAIVYQEESRSYKIFIEDAKRELPPGQNWVKKATYLCRKVRSQETISCRITIILALLKEKSEDKEVKKTIKRLLPQTKIKEIFLAAKRTYDLFSVRGPSYLYFSQRITPYVLYRIRDEDFLLLKKEAQFIVQQEIDAVLQLMDFAGAQS
ncbi:hypothetical protein C2G38_2166814 [Gigaspora rosea]|uniref:Uncharacterized protein n=1 Tax=Gigaspora rosea TaxID=44941 RepID=A0A397VT34_9GLOM|nr:hypothetical protein C2G38_2166814 [Gigaspora rosea]